MGECVLDLEALERNQSMYLYRVYDYEDGEGLEGDRYLDSVWLLNYWSGGCLLSDATVRL